MLEYNDAMQTLVWQLHGDSAINNMLDLRGYCKRDTQGIYLKLYAVVFAQYYYQLNINYLNRYHHITCFDLDG